MKQVEKGVFSCSQVDQLIQVLKKHQIEIDFESDAQLSRALTDVYCSMLKIFECDELYTNTPSVESIASRLARATHKISNLTCVVEWHNGDICCYWNARPASILARDALVISHRVHKDLDASVDDD